MKITRLREILKEEYHMGARKIDGSRYGITSDGETWFSLDISKLRDDQHARERIQEELDYVRTVATRRWQ